MISRLILAALAAATLGAGGRAHAAGPPANLSDAQMRAEFEAKVLEQPGGELFVEIRRFYPAEFAKFEDQLIAGARRGGGSEEARKLGAAFMTDFLSRHMPATRKAPVADMVAMVRANAALAQSLKAENAEACSAMVWGGAFSISGRTDLSLVTRAGVAAYHRSVIAAMAAGEKTPTTHRKFGEADSELLIKALIASGADESAVDIIDKAGQGSPSPEASCSAGVFLLTAIASLPPDSQAAFMSAQ